MKTKIINKLSTPVLMFLALIIFNTVITFGQTPTLRANGKIAFTSDRDGNREIYVMDPDGGKQTRITNNLIVDDHPTWSPDGKKIAFLSQRPQGGFAIFVMDADGTGKTEITPVNYLPLWEWNGWDTWTMSWSPDGLQIAFSDGSVRTSTLIVVNLDGTNRRNLTPGFGPAWSPDGSRILFLREGPANPFLNHLILTIRPDGGDLQNITPSLSSYYTVNAIAPVWSPDGIRIAFGSFDGANMVINIANADGSNPQDFVTGCAARSVPQGCSSTSLPAWSPDGRTIAFTNWGGQSDLEIYTKNIGEDAITRLTDTTGRNSNPNWQPISNPVSISGRVTTPTGLGLRNAVVALTDPLGIRRTATTSSFGFFTFDNVRSGESYLIGVSSKRYRFAAQTLQITDTLTDVNFVGLE